MFAIRMLSEGGGLNTELVGLLYTGIAFFFLIVVVGWLTSSRKQEQVYPAHAAAKPASTKELDDLARIEGIGPKIAKVLRNAELVTFDDLARSKAKDVQRILDGAGYQMMKPEGWIEQAKLASKSDWKGFEKLQKELKSGRGK